MKFVFLILLFLTACSHTGGSAGVWGSGRIDGDEIEVSSKYPGRIVELLVREGDRVKKGQVIARLDSDEIRARVDRARAALDLARADLERAVEDYTLTKREVRLQVEKAKSLMERAEASLRRAQADLSKALSDYRRFLNLYRRRVVAKSRFEQVERIYKLALASKDAAEAELEAAKRSYSIAVARVRMIRVKKALVEAAKRRVEEAEAAYREAAAVLEDMTIRSPIDGVVIEKVADVGEVVGAGATIVVLVDPNALYLKMFVSEVDVGKIALGMPARIYTDAYPDRPFRAKVCYVAQRAEFTPKEVETKEERVHHVFAVKLCPLDNSKGLLKLGMPAEGVIDVGPSR